MLFIGKLRTASSREFETTSFPALKALYTSLNPYESPIKIAVTGAPGQLGQVLIPRIPSGGLFGPDQPVELHLIEIPPSLKALEGVVMELHGCAFPLLH